MELEPKVCSRCGGAVELEVVRHEKGGTSVVGTCRSCGATYDEAAVLKLAGPGPVGG
jgi:uncharacterized Zn finger protein